MREEFPINNSLYSVTSDYMQIKIYEFEPNHSIFDSHQSTDHRPESPIVAFFCRWLSVSESELSCFVVVGAMFSEHD